MILAMLPDVMIRSVTTTTQHLSKLLSSVQPSSLFALVSVCELDRRLICHCVNDRFLVCLIHSCC